VETLDLGESGFNREHNVFEGGPGQGRKMGGMFSRIVPGDSSAGAKHKTLAPCSLAGL